MMVKASLAVLYLCCCVPGVIMAGAETNAVASSTVVGSVGDGYSRAMALLRNGVVFEAVHTMEDYLQQNPNDARGHMQMARMLRRVGRDRRAAAEAAKVLLIEPGNTEAQRLLAGIRIKLGRDLDRKNPDAVLDYARLCSRPETYDRAAKFYDLYFTMKDEPAIRLEYGRMLYWAGRYANAEQQLLVYLKYSPHDSKAWRLMGKVYDALGRFDDAVKAYRTSLEKLGGDDIDVQLDIARSLLWGGHTEESERILSNIRQRSGEYDEPMLLLASIARMQGRIIEEYTLYKEVLKSNPDNAVARRRVAELERGSLLQEARYQDQLRENPGDTATRRKLIYLYLSEQRFGEAIPHLEVLCNQVPQDSESAYELRKAREEEGRRVLAELRKIQRGMAVRNAREIEVCKEWLKRNPNDYATRARLVKLLTDNGENREALAQLVVLDSMLPGQARVAEEMSRLAGLIEQDGSEGKARDK